MYERQTQHTVEIIKTGEKIKICSDKFKKMLNSRLSQRFYDPDFVVING